MVDFESRPERNYTKKKKNKRKQRSAEDEENDEELQRPPKSSLVNSSERRNQGRETEEEKRKIGVSVEGSSPWRNLQLILSLQNKTIDLPTKLELAYDFVKSITPQEEDGSGQVSDTVSLAGTIVFINNWIQSVLISPTKNVRGEECQQEPTPSFLDHRCWVVFKFCLEESLKLHISLSILRDFLRVIHYISRDALSHLNVGSFNYNESAVSGKELELQEIVLSCISLVFSSHGGVLNENLDLWIMVTDTVLKLLREVIRNKLDGTRAGTFILQFSSSLLEPFAKFLRVHPTRKNSFGDFIDRLLEPLLHLSYELHHYICLKNPEWIMNLLKLVEEVLVQGLFHPTHIDGFLNLQSTGKYRTSYGGNAKDRIVVVKSYHRHLFDKLEKIIDSKHVFPLGGIGELLRLFVSCVTKQKGVLCIKEGSRHLEGSFIGHCIFESSYGSSSLPIEKDYNSDAVGAENRKSIFNFFVHIMEYFLFEINTYLQAELEVVYVLRDVLCIFRSVNMLLDSFKQQNIYIRTEDNSEGACMNFLRLIYASIMSFSSKINHLLLSSFGSDKEIKEVLILILKELVVAFHCLLNIEYEVVGDDLESLWGMILSISVGSHSLIDLPDQRLLTSEILHLGCRLIDLYKELRQVNNSIFAVCKAVRLLVSPQREGEACVSNSYCLYSTPLSMLLCSTKFRCSISNAIKSIPEGQANRCIRQLTADISESIEWLKVQCELAHENDFSKPHHSDYCFQFDLRAELLGRALSELYTLILDSMIVTTGNSNPLGVSIKDLMMLICHCSSTVDSLDSDIKAKFLSIISGRTSIEAVGLEVVSLSHWVLVFFFRLYLSCRSLYRQVISLLPPDTSRKMSETMGDSYTAQSGKDWLEGLGQKAEGYFSWMIQPSASLLSIIDMVSRIYLQDSLACCPLLIYVLNAMALQRLTDLNMMIKSLEYLLTRDDKLVETMMIDETGLSLFNKRNKKRMKCLLEMKQEAAGLTKYMMGCILPLVEDQLSICSSKVGSRRNISVHDLHKDNGWDLSIGGLDWTSLPSAIWLIICQNIDIWCSHAAKKELKKFLTLLISCSFPCVSCDISDSGSNSMNKLGHVKNITIHRTSLELLSDSLLYEKRFVRRHIASRFHRILEKSLSTIFPNLGEVYLNSLPNWSEVIRALETPINDVPSDSNNDSLLKRKPSSWSFPRLPDDSCHREQFAPSSNASCASCHSLLNLLTWMPKGYLSSKSFSLFATCILNLERVVVGSLLRRKNMLYLEDHHELFRLFLSCRRTLKNLLMALSEQKMKGHYSSLICVLSKNLSTLLWLLRSLSAVVEFQLSFSEVISSQVEDVLFLLMDHTSYMFLTIGKYQIENAIQSWGNGCEENPSTDVLCQDTDIIEHDQQSELPTNNDEWRHILLVAENLREHVQNSVTHFKAAYASIEVGFLTGFQELKKLSPLISCIQGFLWGLASGLDNTGLESSTVKPQLAKCKMEPLYKLSFFIDACAEFVNYFLHMLLLKDGLWPQSLPNAQDLNMSNSGREFGMRQPSYGINPDVNDDFNGEDGQNSGSLENFSASTCINGGSNSNNCVMREKFHQEDMDVESLLSKVQLFDESLLKNHLLQGFFRGENRGAAYFLRHLFFTSSAILRLKLMDDITPLLQSLIPSLIGISQVLLFEFGSKVGVSPAFSFVWLDGVVKFLEEFGSCFPLSNPLSSRNLYVKLIDLHLKAIGQCIVLEGKRVHLASKESDRYSERPSGLDFSETTLTYETYCLDELKAKLRTSFRVLIQKSSDLHLLSAIQAIERAVVGVQGGCTTNYEIRFDTSDGGKVSSTVAAGIDCLDLILEFVAGRKRLNVVKRHIQSLVACLFNVILHLQGPNIFYGNGNSNEGYPGPDSGSLILMCIEVLTRISGKHALFQLDSCHVAQFLHIPAALFQNFLQFQLSEVHGQSKSPSFSDNGRTQSLTSISGCILDKRHLVELYAACCRLLCTVIKHYKSETHQCAALLEDTVNVLLYCLERINIDAVVRRDNFAWEVQGGVKCACCLRRVYEELRQQKDGFGSYCPQFLSGYIWVYCGYGPLKAGIRREIDEALRPGIYALIDACSADDLQHLHTVFGEGPCRSTLGALQNDYKLNFQYQGKV